jgi:hypothetical protein
MLIRVLCSNKTCGWVEPRALDDLIRRGLVVAFFRQHSNEWVDVGNGTIRRKRKTSVYRGPERRATH